MSKNILPIHFRDYHILETNQYQSFTLCESWQSDGFLAQLGDSHYFTAEEYPNLGKLMHKYLTISLPWNHLPWAKRSICWILVLRIWHTEYMQCILNPLSTWNCTDSSCFMLSLVSAFIIIITPITIITDYYNDLKTMYKLTSICSMNVSLSLNIKNKKKCFNYFDQGGK